LASSTWQLGGNFFKPLFSRAQGHHDTSIQQAKPPVGHGPLSIPKVALRFLIGFCVGELGGKKVFLDISGRSNTKRNTESIMVEPICPWWVSS